MFSEARSMRVFRGPPEVRIGVISGGKRCPQDGDMRGKNAGILGG